jgi:hypothetical protein
VYSVADIGDRFDDYHFGGGVGLGFLLVWWAWFCFCASGMIIAILSVLNTRR